MAHRLLNLAFASLLFGLSIFLWIVADGFPESRRFSQADADFWPKIIFGTMALITGILVVKSFIEVRRSNDTMRSAFEMSADFKGTAIRITLIGILILAYYWGFQTVGFILATFTFLILASFVIAYDNNKIRILFAAGFTAFLVLFFTRALELPLPRGIGVFYDLNVLIY
ncbi:tripartite tricarboxylate transporter TctB family protein [Jannaschia sp. CCS1]|uniref:tripartite tricarboxylate transporter TctB family protein n=1 Tax=Jannaschia sp. (strain CCS1) TaxID=290400 RepID=UPI000053B6C5|nr:tripartite tricarboxylate transporter TctB family protein [Jannaschia sp. CCS1]ABD54077.1 hypothetical protein Jann_1160 [Jannaschia sp. CCS1]